jgi:hypothetical protein
MDDNDDYEAESIGGNELDEGGDEDGGQQDATRASEQTVEDDVEEEEEKPPYVPNKTPTGHGTAICHYCEREFFKQSRNHMICPNPTCQAKADEDRREKGKKIQKITYERERKEEAEEAPPYVPNQTPTRYGTALCRYCEIDFMKQSENHKVCPNPRCQAFLSSIKGERDKQKKKRHGNHEESGNDEEDGNDEEGGNDEEDSVEKKPAAPYVPNNTATRHGTALCPYCEIDFMKQSQNHKVCPNPRCQALKDNDRRIHKRKNAKRKHDQYKREEAEEAAAKERADQARADLDEEAR